MARRLLVSSVPAKTAKAVAGECLLPYPCPLCDAALNMQAFITASRDFCLRRSRDLGRPWLFSS